MRSRRAANLLKIITIAAIAGALGACGSVKGLFGSGEQNPAKTTMGGSGVPPAGTTAAASAATEQGPIAVDFDPITECPPIRIPMGESAFTVYAGEASPANVRYQASVVEFARQCVLDPDNRVRIRIGVAGYMVIGEKGSPGTFSAPLTIRIRNRAEEVIAEREVRVTATVQPDGAPARFRIVENDFVVPISYQTPLRSYELLVGFKRDRG